MLGETISHYRTLEKLGEGGMGMSQGGGTLSSIALVVIPERKQRFV